MGSTLPPQIKQKSNTFFRRWRFRKWRIDRFGETLYSSDPLDRTFDPLDRTFDPLDRASDPLDRTFDPLDRTSDPTEPSSRLFVYRQIEDPPSFPLIYRFNRRG